jgi:hypothetical protein
MGKPEPTPVVKDAEALALLSKLEHHEFTLTPAQRELYRDAKKYYARVKPRE